MRSGRTRAARGPGLEPPSLGMGCGLARNKISVDLLSSTTVLLVALLPVRHRANPARVQLPSLASPPGRSSHTMTQGYDDAVGRTAETHQLPMALGAPGPGPSWKGAGDLQARAGPRSSPGARRWASLSWASLLLPWPKVHRHPGPECQSFPNLPPSPGHPGPEGTCLMS